MRIRKNARLSSGMVSHAETHVCQLNQSPWDVIPFSSSSPLPPSSFQFEGEDSFTGNGSLVDSIGAVESVASPEEKEMIVDDKNMAAAATVTAADDDEAFEEEKRTEGGVLLCCSKNDGKGWQCKRAAKEGHTMCEHHLYTPNHHNAAVGGSNLAKKAPGRKGRGRLGKKGGSSAANPYEFYYYSGFGPQWGKRRGDRVAGESMMRAGPPQGTPSSSLDNQDFDYVDVEDDDDDEVDEQENGDGGKKRMRKPVKARSLKSLM